MKKDYAVNIKSAGSDSDWNTTDMADWYASYDAALSAAEDAFQDQEALEAVVTVFEDGEVDGTPLHMVLEDGKINQYQGGMRLWA